MKRPNIRLVLLCASIAAAVSAYELSSAGETFPALRLSKPKDATLEQRMKQQAQRISSRLGMSAPLDATETTDPATGIDAVQELHASGFIVPATLEEVEAAIHAAAQTPETEDDTAAQALKHRGSYRFFLNN